MMAMIHIILRPACFGGAALHIYNEGELLAAFHAVCWMLRDISRVAAPCSSTPAAIVEDNCDNFLGPDLSSIRYMLERSALSAEMLLLLTRDNRIPNVGRGMLPNPPPSVL
jgi:hypothetical protein